MCGTVINNRNMTDFTCLRTFEGHTGTITKVLFINSGMQLLSAGAEAGNITYHTFLSFASV
jgi:hypothetical protein